MLSCQVSYLFIHFYNHVLQINRLLFYIIPYGYMFL